MASKSVEKRRVLAGEQLTRSMAHQLGLVVDRSTGRTAGQDDPSSRRSPPRPPGRSCCGERRASHARAAAIEPRARVRSARVANGAPRRTPPSPPRAAPVRRRKGRAGRALACALQRSRPSHRRREPERVRRQIEPGPRDGCHIPDKLVHGRLPFRWVDDNDHLGTLMPFGAPSTPSFRPDVANGQTPP